jgi:hypothetical protein
VFAQSPAAPKVAQGSSCANFCALHRRPIFLRISKCMVLALKSTVLSNFTERAAWINMYLLVTCGGETQALQIDFMVDVFIWEQRNNIYRYK